MVLPLIAIGVMSAIPFLLPSDKNKKEQVSQEVINQTGKNYFRRNTYRTNGLNVYSRPPIEQQHQTAIDLIPILLIAGAGLAGLIVLKVIMR